MSSVEILSSVESPDKVGNLDKVEDLSENESAGEGAGETGWLERWPPSAGSDEVSDRPPGIEPARPAVVERGLVADERGQPRLTEAQRRRWGFTPGAEFLIEETAEGILLRRADPALAKVIVEPTSKCNLSCRTCVRHSWDEPTGTMEMTTFDRLVEGLREVPTLRTMAFWGFGEPLLHPGLAAMVDAAKRLGVRTELITNGLLLDREAAERLILAGLDRLVVSVDGASPEAQADIRSGAALERVQRNVQGLHEAREALGRENPEVGLEFVAMRRNVHELPGLRRLANSMGASFVVVTNVLPYTAELRDETLYGYWAGKTYGAGSRWAPEIVVPRIDARRDVVEPVVRLLEHAGTAGPPLPRARQTTGYCRFVNEGVAAVSWDGALSPCVGLMHSYRCYVHGREKRIRRYTLGDVSREPIGDLWAREEYRAFRKRVVDFDFSPCTDCGSCELVETNEADCFGNPFPVCGDCLWAKGVIQCP